MKNALFSFVIFVVAFSSHAARSSKNSTSRSPESVPIMYFKYTTSEYASVSDIEKLRLFFDNYKSLDDKNLHVKIRFFLCPGEKKINNMLGYRRADKIIIYGAKTAGIQKRMFIVQDVSNDFMMPNTCNSSGVMLSIAK